MPIIHFLSHLLQDIKGVHIRVIPSPSSPAGADCLTKDPAASEVAALPGDVTRAPASLLSLGVYKHDLLA